MKSGLIFLLFLFLSFILFFFLPLLLNSSFPKIKRGLRGYPLILEAGA